MVMRILSKPMYHGNRKHALYVNFAGFRDGLLRKMGKIINLCHKEDDGG